MLHEAARLFSEHYGVWAKDAASKVGPFAKAGRQQKEEVEVPI